MESCFHCHRSEFEYPVESWCACDERACKSCAVNCHAYQFREWEPCWNCEDGYTGHHCGEDTCCCKFPEDNVTCDICDGKGGWFRDEQKTAATGATVKGEGVKE
jgi:hypothetical protein